jgi:O-antigen ligase
MTNLFAVRKRFLSEEYRIASLLTIISTILFISFTVFFGGKLIAIVLFPFAIVSLFLILDFNLSLAFVIILLFVDIHVLGFSSAVWGSLILGLSFLLRYRDFEWKEFSNPMTLPILLYGLCIIPSFLNAIKPLVSIMMLFNVAAFLIVMYSIVAGIRSRNDIAVICLLYIALAFLNSIDVFRLAWLGEKRPTGFAGIMFVDYSALGVCLSITIAMISKGPRRLFFLITSFVITIALILTQTRNTWLSAGITLCILVGYLLFHPEFIGFSRKRLLTLSVAVFIMMAGVVMLTLVFNPKIEKRATELTTKTDVKVDEWGNVANSMVSRYFIWNTALNAFLKHPFVGIGVYAFPYSSQYYYKYPKIFYLKFVKNCSPHQTHLAVLTETGIIGFFGFLVFIIAALRCAFQAIREAREEVGKHYALVAAMGVVYCTVSMMFTDAWLWGQGIVLFGGILGSMLANKKIAIINISSS